MEASQPCLHQELETLRLRGQASPYSLPHPCGGGTGPEVCGYSSASREAAGSGQIRESVGPGQALGETHEAGGGVRVGVECPSQASTLSFETSPNVLSASKSSLTGSFSPSIFQGSRAWCQPRAFGLFMPLADCGVHQDGHRTPPCLLQIPLQINNITDTVEVLAPLPSPFLLPLP